jgi:hypothetical protein
MLAANTAYKQTKEPSKQDENNSRHESKQVLCFVYKVRYYCHIESANHVHALLVRSASAYIQLCWYNALC